MATNAGQILNQSGQQPGVVPYDKLPQLMELIDNLQNAADELNRLTMIISEVAGQMDGIVDHLERTNASSRGSNVSDPQSSPGSSGSRQSGYSSSSGSPGSGGSGNNSSIPFGNSYGSSSGSSGPSNPDSLQSWRPDTPPPPPPLRYKGEIMGAPILIHEHGPRRSRDMYQEGPRQFIMEPNSPPPQQQYSPPPSASGGYGPMASTPPPGVNPSPPYFNASGSSNESYGPGTPNRFQYTMAQGQNQSNEDPCGGSY